MFAPARELQRDGILTRCRTGFGILFRCSHVKRLCNRISKADESASPGRTVLTTHLCSEKAGLYSAVLCRLACELPMVSWPHDSWRYSRQLLKGSVHVDDTCRKVPARRRVLVYRTIVSCQNDLLHKLQDAHYNFHQLGAQTRISCRKYLSHKNEVTKIVTSFK